MPAATPTATYRLQLTKEFGFDDAAAIVPYLKQLGISHIYASPFLKARPGSTHGYDIVDHDRLNPELGGDDGFARLSDALKKHDLGLILDFVPNHMGVGHADNAWWLDVLEWGPKSPYAMAFDIDWEGLPYRTRPGVLLPILGRPYGEALENGEIELKYDASSGAFAAWYFDHKLPINPQRYSELLRTLVSSAANSSSTVREKLLALAEDYRDPRTPSYRDAAVLKRCLSEIDGAPEVIEAGLAAYHPNDQSSIEMLHRLLERQNYRLAYWRIAFSAVNYRRFFNINDLAGLRVENAATFRAMHGLVSRLIAADQLQGLRLDHIDGLRDPMQYTRRLQHLIHKTRGSRRRRQPFYVIVEKILGESEQMPRLPGVAGTTGYEWLNVISRLLVQGEGLAPLERTWRNFTGEDAGFPAMLEAAKLRVIDTMLASEFTVLSRALARIAAGHFSTRDFTLNRLRAALQLYVLEFPVYRTYVTAAGGSAHDRELIEAVIARARARWHGPDPAIFDFLRDAITLDLSTHPGYSAPRVRDFALKLQQFTGPLMAKSAEDTAFYRYHRLLALNEVGGEPAASALSLDEFYRQQQTRIQAGAEGLTATATHDTKRGEDARMRILSLSELAAQWESTVREWGKMNAALVRHDGDRRMPSPGHEYMLYQALIGAWPQEIDATFVERMQAYAVKAARESKQETSWTNPDESYEAGLREFVAKLLDPGLSSAFIASFEIIARQTALFGALNGLSQLALKALLPGIPDFYQGSEFWDLSLVDPDNRRPVDFELRRETLSGTADWNELAQNWSDGRIKLALMRCLLHVRLQFTELLRHGALEPVTVTGRDADHVIAFWRKRKDDRLFVAIGRHFGGASSEGKKWAFDFDVTFPDLPAGLYDDLVVERQIEVPFSSGPFAELPVRVLRPQ